MAEPPAEGRPSSTSTRTSKGRSEAAATVRLIVGLAAVLVAVLAVLALLNSFFIEPQPGPISPDEPAPGDEPSPEPSPDPEPSPGDEPGEGSGGGESDPCQALVDALMWVFFGIAATSIVLLGVAYAMGRKRDGRILTSIWGVLSIVAAGLALLALGAWRLVDFLCKGDFSCANLVDGSWTTFLVMFALTTACLAGGIALAHLRNITFFRTGIGIVGIVMFLPTVAVAFVWYFLRLLCEETISCSLRDQFLADLAGVFWLSLISGVLALGVGVLLKVRRGRGVWASGWAVLATLLLVLAALAGFGWLFVDSIKIPFCDTIPEEMPEEPPTCGEVLDRIGLTFWILVGLVAALVVAGLIFHRKRPKRFFSSPFAIAAYVILALAVVTGVGYLMLASLCQGEGETLGDGDSTDQPGEPADPGGGGGGGGGAGPGGGGGGDGSAAPRPIELQPLPVSWILIVMAAVLGAALLVLVLRQRRALLEGLGGTIVEPGAVSEAEQMQLMRILEKRRLNSNDAIVAAYRVFLAWSAGQGSPKLVHETPSEHSQRIRKAYNVPARAMQEFIRAYEVARLSGRKPSPAERRLAVEFSREILGRGPPPEEPP